MKTLITTLLLFILVESRSQDNFTLSLAYPKQLSNHWAIGQWKSHYTLKATYEKIIKKSMIGVGIGFTSFGFDWGKHFYVELGKRNVSDISPYLSVGFNAGDRITFAPRMKLGYSLLINNSVAPDKQIKSGVYLGPQMNLNYQVSNKVFVGVNADFNLILQKIDFAIDSFGLIIETEHKTYKYYSLGIYAGYRW